jgi:GNAT superfamily N-acetyltransferase
MSETRPPRPENLHPRGYASKRFAAADLIEMLGWRKAVREVAPWLLERKYLFFWYDLRHIAAARPAGAPISLERAGESNLSDIMALRPGYYTRELLEKRLARGHAGFLGRSRGRPVFSRWVFLDRVYLPYLGRTLSLPQGDCFTDETYVAPPFRGQGIFSGSVFSFQTALREMGMVRTFSAVASWNEAPLKDAPRAGGILFGACRIIRRFGGRAVSWKGEIRDAGDGTISFLAPPDQPGFSTT